MEIHNCTLWSRRNLSVFWSPSGKIVLKFCFKSGRFEIIKGAKQRTIFTAHSEECIQNSLCFINDVPSWSTNFMIVVRENKNFPLPFRFSEQISDAPLSLNVVRNGIFCC